MLGWTQYTAIKSRTSCLGTFNPQRVRMHAGFHNIIGASLSEPHINGTAMREFYIIGASLSEPHIDETNARNPYIYVICMVRPSRANRCHGDLVPPYPWYYVTGESVPRGMKSPPREQAITVI